MGRKRKKLRSRLKIPSSKEPGAAPGTLVHVGEQKLDQVRLTVHDYDEEHIDEIPITEIEESKPYLDSVSKTWIRVRGVHDVEKLQTIWSYFDLHPLIQEDILNTSQRPKAEQYDNNIFFVLRMLSYHEENQVLETEQVSIVLGPNYVLSFQESDTAIFAPILERLKLGGRIRKLGPDYLTYTLIDVIVDHYFKVLGSLGEQLEVIEDELLEDPSEKSLQKIHTLRRELIFFRKSVWSLRDTLNSVIRDDTPFIKDKNKVFIRDVYDHMVQIIDNIENYRDMLLGMHDMYMSYVSNRMNEVMKVLTIIATIFIPMTFIAGIYGMNFNPEASPLNMPELNWYWGYPVVWLVMIFIAVAMFLYFKRKGWY